MVSKVPYLLVAKRQEILSLSHRQRKEPATSNYGRRAGKSSISGQIWTGRSWTMSDTRHGNLTATVLFKRVFLSWHGNCFAPYNQSRNNVR
ncbi:hypothetical protein LPU83_pLPU83b_0578 (plasmid) [Rhizobium favelukesii]|uniref:Uncharacterized protein n=1 Tax=Rhizobium favelukesii TaxID=348824 RepID=W6RNX2_9HYPH|nr:hypothetical protein LPU83_pLPU83b_0578 [Rhizobium favelukesii]